MLFDLDFIKSMRSNPLRNYVIPGLTSSLIGREKGCVRLFESERDQQQDITPHSHRFDFLCLVLAGTVRNRIWTRCAEPLGDLFQISTLECIGGPGKYEQRRGEWEYYRYSDDTYSAGQSYAMDAEQIHSIFFGKGAIVLFFEGPEVSSTSLFLEPVANGKVIPTFKTEEWMFQKGRL